MCAEKQSSVQPFNQTTVHALLKYAVSTMIGDDMYSLPADLLC